MKNTKIIYITILICTIVIIFMGYFGYNIYQQNENNKEIQIQKQQQMEVVINEVKTATSSLTEQQMNNAIQATKNTSIKISDAQKAQILKDTLNASQY